LSLFEYIAKGGLIAYILVFFNVCGVSIILWKMLNIRNFSRSKGEVCDDILDTIEDSEVSTTEATSLSLLKNLVQERIQSLEKGLNTIRIIASTSPLLGLLGTVLGILKAFENMAIKGAEDPAIFADSISLALITTVLGLIVAVPHYIAYNYLTGFIYKLEAAMEKHVVRLFIESKR